MNSKEFAETAGEESAVQILEVAAMHYTLVVKRDWENAEKIAQKLAEMAALAADGALLMGQ